MISEIEPFDEEISSIYSLLIHFLFVIFLNVHSRCKKRKIQSGWQRSSRLNRLNNLQRFAKRSSSWQRRQTILANTNDKALVFMAISKYDCLVVADVGAGMWGAIGYGEMQANLLFRNFQLFLRKAVIFFWNILVTGKFAPLHLHPRFFSFEIIIYAKKVSKERTAS